MAERRRDPVIVKSPHPQIFGNRNSIVSCIADLEGSPDRDYSIFRNDSLYHTALRFDEAFELDESVTDLI